MSARFLVPLILLFSLLQACVRPTPVDHDDIVLKQPVKIVGGEEVGSDSFESSFVAMIYGESADGQSFICSGTFISENTLLTANHCVVDDISMLSVFFNNKPFEDADSHSLTVTGVRRPTEDEKVKAQRQDLALIYFSGGLPAGARIAEVPKSGQILEIASEMLLLGYGRTEGLADSLHFSDELGTLRGVKIPREHLYTGGQSFVVDQTFLRGACFGDSGGPALVKAPNSGHMMVVGVASGVTGNPSPGSGDDCAFQSIYMDTFKHREWIAGPTSP